MVIATPTDGEGRAFRSFLASPIEGHEPAPDLTEDQAERDAAGDVGSVMDLDMDPAQSHDAGHAEVDRRQGWVGVAQERCRTKRRRGVAAREARRARYPEGKWAGGVRHRTASSEEGLDAAAYDDRFDADTKPGPQGGPPVSVAPQAQEGGEHHPDHPVIAKLGRSVEEAIGGPMAAQRLEGAVDGGVEALDSFAGQQARQANALRIDAAIRGGSSNGPKWLSPSITSSDPWGRRATMSPMT